MDTLALYTLLALCGMPLWWPALCVVLGEVRLAAESQAELPSTTGAVTVRSRSASWSTRRTRLAALSAARQISSPRRWEGGFGRRYP